MARLFFMAIPAFFAFLLTYIVFGMDKDALIGGLFIGAVIWQLGFEVTAPRKDRGEF
jgi:Na+/proline symporter